MSCHMVCWRGGGGGGGGGWGGGGGGGGGGIHNRAIQQCEMCIL